MRLDGLANTEFTPEELKEVFQNSPLREVAFEVRFPPRLRVPAEIWRLQDKLVQKYPEVGRETSIQANGAVTDVAVFQNPAESRVIKVSHQNFVIAFTRYVRFEEFKAEVLNETELFCSIFDIDLFSRIGLRYVNQITLPSTEPASLIAYLRPLVSFNSFAVEMVDQFALELRTHYRDHSATIRTALLPGLLRTYVLDIDCHTSVLTPAQECPMLLDRFHDSAQRVFLDHITEEYKHVMRGPK
jgi:uncharacterized protein (TIGR04255 family)